MPTLTSSLLGINHGSRAPSDLSSLPRLSFIEQLNRRTLLHTPPPQLIRFSREERHLLLYNTPKIPLYARKLTRTFHISNGQTDASQNSWSKRCRTDNRPNGCNVSTKITDHTVSQKYGQDDESRCSNNVNKEICVPAPSYPPEVVTKTDLAEFEKRMINSISNFFDQLCVSQSDKVIYEVRKIIENERLVINPHFDESKPIVEKFGEDMKSDFEKPLPLSIIVDEQHINKRLNGIQRLIDENFRAMESLRNSYKRSRAVYESYVAKTTTDNGFDNSDPSGGSLHQKGEKDMGEPASKRRKAWPFNKFRSR